jgi:hypothetical protein
MVRIYSAESRWPIKATSTRLRSGIERLLIMFGIASLRISLFMIIYLFNNKNVKNLTQFKYRLMPQYEKY